VEEVLEKMSILFVHRYYFPDSPPYASILKDMRGMQAFQGGHVDILASQPSYKSEDKSKVIAWKVKDDLGIVRRLPVFKSNNQKINKAFNFFWFPFLSFWVVLFGKEYKVVTVSTAPPILLAFSVALACKIRGMKLVYHCMDIHPEIGRISGEFKREWVFNFLIKLDQFTCRVASRIIVLSGDMKQSLMQRGGALQNKIEIINNYNLGDNQLDKQNFFNQNDGKFRIVFAGNIGRFQNLDVLVTALCQANKKANVQLIFVGEGAALNQLKNMVKELKLEEFVQFIPHQPLEIAKKIIKDSQIAIVSLQEEIIHYAYPSKTMTYLSLGIPILALVEGESELAETIINHNLGFVCSPKDMKNLSDVISNLDKKIQSIEKSNIQKYFNRTFSKSEFQLKFLHLIEAIL
jgi:colanic acid biosynthesis glycosyl transferase WcaI